MTLVETALSVLVNAGLGAWLGTMVFFSFLGAPTAFDVLGEDQAGTYVNATFPKYYLFGVAAGALALLAGGATALLGGPDAAVAVALAGTLVGLGLFAYSRWVLIPKMDRAGADAFQQYHRQSVVLNGVAMLAVGVALVAANL